MQFMRSLVTGRMSVYDFFIYNLLYIIIIMFIFKRATPPPPITSDSYGAGAENEREK